MAHNQTEPDVRKIGRQSITRGKRITKQQSQSATRKSARLERIKYSQKQAGSRDKSTRRNPFPSPSISNTRSIEKPSDLGPKLGRKRKRSHEPKNAVLRSSLTPPSKRPRTSLATFENISEQEAANRIGNNNTNLVDYWKREGSWPKAYFEPDPNMSQQLTRKSSRSSISYTQSVKQGDNPPAYTPEYEEVLAKAGIKMYYHPGETTISDNCKKLCTTLLEADYDPPEDSLFDGDFFWTTLDRVRSRNEARVVRDITPYIVPSAEHLFTRGASGLNYLIEEIEGEWSRCIPLAGPQPKPDFAVGLSPSAFTDSEVEKLKYYTAPQKPTLFTGNFYFPFLLCEVKCGENGLNIADRQNAHSASMAVNAIFQLHREEAFHQEPQTVSRAEELQRKILVFSISHDHTMVKIYGHYALIEGAKITFHRHLIRSFDFTDRDGNDRWTAYKFVRKVYDHFAPIHLKRIQSAVARLREPLLPTSAANVESESELAFDSTELATSATSSYNTAGFKKPRLTATAMLREQLAQRDQQLAQRDEQLMLLLKNQTPSNASATESELQREYDRQVQEIEQLNNKLSQEREQLNNKLSQEREQLNNKLSQEREQLNNKLSQEREQLNNKLSQEREQSNQRLAELMKQMAQEKEESKQRHKELTEQNRELMSMLKQRIT